MSTMGEAGVMGTSAFYVIKRVLPGRWVFWKYMGKTCIDMTFYGKINSWRTVPATVSAMGDR